MRTKCKVKYVDFAKMAKKDRDFGDGAVGLYCFTDNTAYVDKSLPIINKGTKRLCLNHELVHARTVPVGIDDIYGSSIEEQFVELEAIVRTPENALSAGEGMLKRYLTNGFKLKPSNKKELKTIVKNIFKFIDVNITDSVVKQIVTGKTKD